MKIVNIERKYWLVFSLILIYQHGFSQSVFFVGGNICSDASYRLVFSDEFDGDSLDRSKWINYFPYTPDGSDQCEFCRTHGDEGQIFTDTNHQVSNGTLKLIARKQTATWFSATRDYTSGLIHSTYHIKFMYGKFEARCKIPEGKGLMSAFWMFGGTGDGIGTEIDAFEIDGADPKHHGMGIIKWHETEFFDRHDCSIDDIDLSTDFHTYAVEWEPFFITFFVDGRQVFKISRFYELNGTQVTWCCVRPGVYAVLPAFPPSRHNFVYLNVSFGVGAGDDAPNSNTVFPNQLEVDYVRVYEREPLTGENFDCELTIFPNPSTGNLSLKKKRMLDIRVINIWGEILLSESAGGDEHTLNIQDVPEGLYFIEVLSEDGIFAGKFLKQ